MIRSLQLSLQVSNHFRFIHFLLLCSLRVFSIFLDLRALALAVLFLRRIVASIRCVLLLLDARISLLLHIFLALEVVLVLVGLACETRNK